MSLPIERYGACLVLVLLAGCARDAGAPSLADRLRASICGSVEPSASRQDRLAEWVHVAASCPAGAVQIGDAGTLP